MIFSLFDELKNHFWAVLRINLAAWVPMQGSKGDIRPRARARGTEFPRMGRACGALALEARRAVPVRARLQRCGGRAIGRAHTECTGASSRPWLELRGVVLDLSSASRCANRTDPFRFLLCE